MEKKQQRHNVVMRNQNGLEIKNSHREHTLESSVRTLELKKTSLVSNVCYDVQLTKPTPTAQIWLLDEVSLLVLT